MTKALENIKNYQMKFVKPSKLNTHPHGPYNIVTGIGQRSIERTHYSNDGQYETAYYRVFSILFK